MKRTTKGTKNHENMKNFTKRELAAIERVREMYPGIDLNIVNQQYWLDQKGLGRIFMEKMRERGWSPPVQSPLQNRQTRKWLEREIKRLNGEIKRAKESLKVRKRALKKAIKAENSFLEKS